MKRFLIGAAASGIMLASLAGTTLADGPTSPNISSIVVPLAQTGTFGQTVCSVLGQANLENNVVLTTQGHDASHIN
jgi:hypothetical protein